MLTLSIGYSGDKATAYNIGKIEEIEKLPYARAADDGRVPSPQSTINNLIGYDVGVNDQSISSGMNFDNTKIQNSSGATLAQETPNGTVTKEYSLSTWTPEERDRVRNQLQATGKYTTEEINKWIEDVDSIAATTAADKDRLDFDADPDQVFMKPNQEYIVTLDASTLCAKRRLFQGTYNAIQHLLPNTVIGANDIIDLTNMLKDYGHEAPCGVCYVESRRTNLGKFAKQFINKFDGDYIPKIDELTTTDGNLKLKKEHPDVWNAFIKEMNRKGSSNPKNPLLHSVEIPAMISASYGGGADGDEKRYNGTKKYTVG